MPRQALDVAEPLPHLLGDVRGEGGEQERERLGQGARDGCETRDLVVQLDQLRDGGVEAQGFDVLADLLDGAVHLPVEHLGHGRVDNLRDLPRLLVPDQVAPHRIEKPEHADDVPSVPRLLRFQRPHVHLVQPEAVGPIVPDDLVGVDDVPPALAHLEAARVDGDLRVGAKHVALAALLDHLLFHRVGNHLLAGALVNAGQARTFGEDFFLDLLELRRAHVRAVGAGEDVVFHLPQDQPLVHQPPERLGRGDVAQVEEHLVPEARVEQVQHRVLDAADVQVDRHPVALLFRVDEPTVVVGVAVAQVIPARPCPLRHRVGLAGVHRPVHLHPQPVLRLAQRRLGGARGLEVLHLGKGDGQVFFVDRVGKPLVIEQDGKRLAPVALSAEQPVAQLVVHAALAEALFL